MIGVDINQALSTFNDGLKFAGECMECPLYLGTDKKQKWFDYECVCNRKELRKLLKIFHKSNSDKDRTNYTEKRKEYKYMLKRKKSQYKQTLLDTLHKHRHDPKLFWQTLRSVRVKTPVSNSISGDVWLTHFQEVFNSSNHCDDSGCSIDDENDINDDHPLNETISVDEVNIAIGLLRNNKAAGPDGLIGEFFKHSAANVVPFLTKFFNVLFDKGLYPDAWCEAIIQPLHKKGDSTVPGNYRGISLLNISSKLYSCILKKKITRWVDKNQVIGEKQTGFRKKA